jgi:integrase/recombinase XerD
VSSPLGSGEGRSERADVRRNAVQFRDAFQVALLAVRPFRIKNFAEMALGSNLIHRGATWWLVYVPEETENHRSLEVQFPETLLP